MAGPAYGPDSVVVVFRTAGRRGPHKELNAAPLFDVDSAFGTAIVACTAVVGGDVAVLN